MSRVQTSPSKYKLYKTNFIKYYGLPYNCNTTSSRSLIYKTKPNVFLYIIYI